MGNPVNARARVPRVALPDESSLSGSPLAQTAADMNFAQYGYYEEKTNATGSETVASRKWSGRSRASKILESEPSEVEMEAFHGEDPSLKEGIRRRQTLARQRRKEEQQASWDRKKFDRQTTRRQSAEEFVFRSFDSDYDRATFAVEKAHSLPASRAGRHEHPRKARRKVLEQTKRLEKQARADFRLAMLKKSQTKKIEKKEKQFEDGRVIKTESGAVDALEEFLAQVGAILGPLSKSRKLASTMGSFSTLVYQLYRSRNVIDVGAAAYQFTLAADLGAHAPIVLALVKKELSHLESLLRGQPIVAESLSDNLAFVKAAMSRVLTGELVTTLRNLLLSAVSLKWFDTDLSSRVTSWMGRPPKMDTVSMFSYCLDQAVALIRIGESLIAGVPVSDVLFAKDPVTEQIREIQELLFYADKLYNGLPVEGKLCYREFLERAGVSVKTAETLLKIANPLASSSIELNKQYVRLREAYYVARTRMSTGQRPTPYGVVLYGDPGVGKSRILPFIADVYSDVKGRRYQDGHMYHRIVTSQFWENYDPVSQPFVHYSEIGNMSEKLAAARGDTTIEEVTSLIDSLPFPVDMAFEDKGKVFAQPEVVIVDTNSPDMNLGVLVKNPAAYKRRFLYIEPLVKPAFRVESTSSLDTAKSLASDIPTMDRWTFRVYYYRANGPKVAIPVYLMNGGEDDDIYKFVRVLRAEFTKHILNQEALEERMTDTCRASLYGSEQKVDEVHEGGAILVESGLLNPYGVADQAKQVLNALPKWQVPLPMQRCGRYVRLLSSSLGSTMFFTILAFALGGVADPGPTYITFREALMLCVSLSVLWVDRIFLFVPLLCLCYLLALRTLYVRMFLLSSMQRRVSVERQRHAAYSMYLLGLNADYQLLVSNWWRKNSRWLMYALAAASASVVCYSLFTKRRKYVSKVTEASSKFYEQHAENEILNAQEDMLECGSSYARIPLKHHQLWNVQQIVTAPCSHRGPIESLYQSIERNIRHVIVRTNSERTTYVFGICGNFALVNTHALGNEREPVMRVSTTGRLDVTNTVFIDSVITPVDRVDLGDDLSMVSLKGIKFRDVRQHLSILDHSLAAYNGYFNGHSVRVHRLTEHHVLESPEGPVRVNGLWSYHFPDHYSGACGLPVLIQKNAGSCVVGMHAGGESVNGYSVVLDKAKVMSAVDELKRKSPFVALSSEGLITTEALGVPIMKSPFRHEILHGVNYFGKLDGNVLVKQKSHLQKTKIADPVLDMMFETLEFVPTVLFGRPLMAPRTIDGVYRSPYNLALNKLAAQRGTLSSSVMSKVIDVYVHRLVKGLRAAGLTKLSPLNVESAINGAETDPFIRRINATTSGGYGYAGPKSKYIPVVSEGERLIREPVADLKARISSIIEVYLSGVTTSTVYSAQLKDEPREMAKVHAGKTRVFYASPLDALVVSRMLLSPFFSLMPEHGDLFCSAVGINMHSGAGEFITSLTEFSPLLLEGDYSNFDQSMPFDIGWAANTIVYRVLEEFGYNQAALTLLNGLLTDLLFPMVEMNRDLFEVPALQPSGKFATAEDNCLRNVVMVMYYWYSHPVLKDKDFFQYVRVKTYGDDLLAAVSPKVAEHMNALDYGRFCEQVYLLGFTSAQKGTELVSFVDMHTCTFLKRHFVYRNDLQMWVAPLDMNSLMRSLMWMSPSKAVSAEEQMLGTVSSFLWELAFHVTEAKHFEIRKQLGAIMAATYCGGTTPDLPSFGYIIAAVKGEEEEEISTEHSIWA